MRQGTRWGARALNEAEFGFLHELFGDSLSYRRVVIGAVPLARAKRAVSPWGSQAYFPRHYFVDGDPREPLLLTKLSVRASLAHEATHIWQRQHGEAVTRRALPLQLRYLFGTNVYAYDASIEQPSQLLGYFKVCSVEQQAKMVEDLVRGRGAPSKWGALRDYLRSRRRFPPKSLDRAAD